MTPEPSEAASAQAREGGAPGSLLGAVLEATLALWWTQKEEAEWKYLLKNVLAGLSGGERKRNTVFSLGVCSPAGIHSRFRYWKGSSECNFCTIIFHKCHGLKISSAKRWPDAARAPCAFPRASHHPPTHPLDRRRA